MKKEYSERDKEFLEKNGRLIFLAFIKPIINGIGFDFTRQGNKDWKKERLHIDGKDIFVIWI